MLGAAVCDETGAMTCPSCAEIAEVERNAGGPWAIARLRTGYVTLNPTQYYAGATFFVAKRCVAELHDLAPDERATHLLEMAAVAAAVFRAVDARKMNYEALGNSVPHLHWWLTPRHLDDPRPKGPIWEDMDFLRLLWTGQARATDDESSAMRARILGELERGDVQIERAFL
jgi:diadenosine tetraphosphate (Ap4A) HIT family hydrolase